MSNSKDDALTEGEFERLWEAAREDELDRIIFVLAGELGLRGWLHNKTKRLFYCPLKRLHRSLKLLDHSMSIDNCGREVGMPQRLLDQPDLSRLPV